MISGKRPAGTSSAHEVIGAMMPGGEGTPQTGSGTLNTLDSDVEASLALEDFLKLDRV